MNMNSNSSLLEKLLQESVFLNSELSNSQQEEYKMCLK
jgi:hypothetical protein